MALVRRERLDSGSFVCPRLHGETRTRGNGGESGRPAPTDGWGPRLWGPAGWSCIQPLRRIHSTPKPVI